MSLSLQALSQDEFEPLTYENSKFNYKGKSYSLYKIGDELDLNAEDAVLYNKIKSANSWKKFWVIAGITTTALTILSYDAMNNLEGFDALLAGPFFLVVTVTSGLTAVGSVIGIIVCSSDEYTYRNKWIKSVNTHNADRMTLKLGLIPQSGNIGFTITF